MYLEASQKSRQCTQKTQPIRNHKKMPNSKEKRSKIVLFNTKMIHQFWVFQDEEIGVSLKFQSTIQETNADEDYDSSEEVVEQGVKKCLNLIKRKLCSNSKKARRSQSESSEEGTKECSHENSTELNEDVVQ